MAPLSSMTGFARVSGEAEWGSWAWEAKSVNGRGLDVRVSFPPGFEAMERAAKAAASERFKRGSLQVSLKIERPESGSDLTVNAAALKTLMAAHKSATGRKVVPRNAVATLMTIKGVVESGSSSLRDLAQDKAAIDVLTLGVSQVFDELLASRQNEGERLNTIMSRLIDEMETELGAARVHAQSQPSLLKARMEKQLAELDTESKVDADRLAAEIALSAAKSDVREELDRLAAHIETARAHLADGSPIGRKLDFLAQELNREANTLCSKSIQLDLTNVGLALKGLVDQFKEQAANVE